MKRSLFSIFMVICTSLIGANLAHAAKGYPSVAGDWSLAGRMTAKACIEGYGCEKTSDYFTGDFSFNPDNSVISESEYIGEWQQSKKKINITMNIAELELMVNDFIDQETGLDFYINITDASFKFDILKNGNDLKNGKLYIKFEFFYEDIDGKGAINTKFTGSRIENGLMEMTAVIDTEKTKNLPLVSVLGKFLIDNYIHGLSK